MLRRICVVLLCYLASVVICLLHCVCSYDVLPEVEVEVNLRPTVSRPVCLGVRRPSGTFDQFFFLLENPFRHLRVCYFVAPSLTRGRVCNLLQNCFWALPEQSLVGRRDPLLPCFVLIRCKCQMFIGRSLPTAIFGMICCTEPVLIEV
jgi:hypothetical protein